MRVDPLDAFGPSPLFQVPFTSNFLFGVSQDALSLTVPNDGMLLGFAFDVQGLDIDLGSAQTGQLHGPTTTLP